jgi:hypothetical protein
MRGCTSFEVDILGPYARDRQFAYTFPLPTEAPYSGLLPSPNIGDKGDNGTGFRIDHRRRVCISVEGEYAIGRNVVQDRIGIFGGLHTGQSLERLQVEHHYGFVVARSGESVARGFGDCRSMSALNASDFAKEFTGVLVNHHDSILSGNEEPVIRWIRYNGIPTAFSSELVGVRDAI